MDDCLKQSDKADCTADLGKRMAALGVMGISIAPWEPLDDRAQMGLPHVRSWDLPPIMIMIIIINNDNNDNDNNNNDNIIYDLPQSRVSFIPNEVKVTVIL